MAARWEGAGIPSRAGRSCTSPKLPAPARGSGSQPHPDKGWGSGDALGNGFRLRGHGEVLGYRVCWGGRALPSSSASSGEAQQVFLGPFSSGFIFFFFFSSGPLFSGFSKPGAKPERGHLCLGAAEPRVLGLCVWSRLLAALPAPLAARSCLKTRLPLSTLHSKHCAKVQAGAVDAVHQCASCRPAGPVRAVQGWEVK